MFIIQRRRATIRLPSCCWLRKRRWSAQHANYLLATNVEEICKSWQLSSQLHHCGPFLPFIPSILHTSPSHMELKWVNPCFPCSMEKRIHIHHCCVLFPDTIVPKQWPQHKDFFLSLPLEHLQITGFISDWLRVNYFRLLHRLYRSPLASFLRQEFQIS